MSEEKKSGLDAVEEGPLPSDPSPEDPVRPNESVEVHPSVEALRDLFSDAILRDEVAAGDEAVVYVAADRNLEILGWLKSDAQHSYDLLRDVTAVDYGGGRPLEVVYQLWSIPHRRALRLKCELDPSELSIDSVVSLWETANWLEREVFDLFGIDFVGHPDLRRILMPEDYAEGHPLRKDFPLRGRFSRAEQTRRALDQDVDRFYTTTERELGREPQLAVPVADEPEGKVPERPEEGA